MARERLFDGQLLDLLKLLVQYRGLAGQILPLVREYSAITSPMDTTVGMRARTSVAIKVAIALAAATESNVDDEAARYLGEVLQNEAVIAVLADLLHRVMPSPTGGFGASAQPEFQAAQAAAAEAGIPWDKLVKFLPILLQILALFAKQEPV